MIKESIECCPAPLVCRGTAVSCYFGLIDGIGSALRFFVSSMTILDFSVATCLVEVSAAINALKVFKSLVWTFKRKSVSPVVMLHSRISALRFTRS